MRALVTGVTGQDGSCLAAQLVADGHEVYGLVRWNSTVPGQRDLVAREIPGLRLLDGDLMDQSSLERALDASGATTVFNLAAIASSGQSWAQPLMMGEVNALGVLKLLEAIRAVNPDIRLVHASTSEQYGAAPECPQTELTPFNALNVYGVAKTFAHQAVVNYRDSFGMHASTALMHNHVSFRRSEAFVDRKITRAAARIALGLQETLSLGKTDAARDWGWGPEYMTVWPLIARHDEPGDYIIATGESHTVREFIDTAFAAAGVDPAGRVITDPSLLRPTDVTELRGCPERTAKRLGWRAQVRFSELVDRLVRHDIAELKETL